MKLVEYQRRKYCQSTSMLPVTKTAFLQHHLVPDTTIIVVTTVLLLFVSFAVESYHIQHYPSSSLQNLYSYQKTQRKHHRRSSFVFRNHKRLFLEFWNVRGGTQLNPKLAMMTNKQQQEDAEVQQEESHSSSNMVQNKRQKVVPDDPGLHQDTATTTVGTSSNVISRSSSSFSSSPSTFDTIQTMMQDRINGMNERAKREEKLNENEVNDILRSIRNVMMDDILSSNSIATNNNAAKLGNDVKDFLLECAHLSHKNWDRTGRNGVRFGQDVLQIDNIPNNTMAQTMLRRILLDGNWKGAVEHSITAATSATLMHPWIVLVTGVNGIRKTTSMYQSWFPTLLKEALIVPEGCNDDVSSQKMDISCLPAGCNSFFRQLDHMIATLCNEDFKVLYSYARDLLLAYEQQQQQNNQRGEQRNENRVDDIDDNVLLKNILNYDPPSNIIKLYSDLKASIFTRYRTLSEFLGVHLLQEAQKLNLNCMLETSGRDVAMFHYVDHFFPTSSSYHKLALHFTINDLRYAQESVDRRMVHEIHTGIRALAPTGTVRDIIQSNAGGPYGSEVLPGVQRDSDQVWNHDIMNRDNKDRVGKDWYKATIQINAYPDNEPWTAQAVLPDGSLGKTLYVFSKQ